MIVHAGDLVTVQVSGEVQGLLTTDDLSQQVSAAIQVAGWGVRSISFTTPTWWNVVSGAWLHYLYTGTIVIVPQWDDDASSVSDLVSSSILSVTGLAPTAIEVTSGATDAASHPIGTMTPDLVNPLASGVKQLGWGLVILVALLVVLLVARPELARAA